MKSCRRSVFYKTQKKLNLWIKSKPTERDTQDNDITKKKKLKRLLQYSKSSSQRGITDQNLLFKERPMYSRGPVKAVDDDKK